MKKISLIAAAALSLVSLASQAGTATGNFNVTVGLTPVCQLKTAAADMAFSYTAFQASASTASTTVTFQCTRGFGAAPTVQLDTGTDASAGAAGATTNGAGVVGGLQYTLSVAGGSLTAGSAATTSSIGSANEYAYAISGSMASGQAGDKSAATSQTRTLTVTY